MASFTGKKSADIADAVAGTLSGFTGGSIAELQDSIGDSFLCDAGDDSVLAGSGDDTLQGGTGNDTLNGGDGNDRLIGAGDDNVLNGGNGDDTITGGYGFNTMDGGEGTDTHDVHFFGGAYNWNMATGVTNFVGETAINFENARLGDGKNLITGTAGANSIEAGGGNDTITGAGGNDTIAGGADNDVLNGSRGDDQVTGGWGNDLISGGAGKDALDGGGGADTISGGAGRDTLTGSVGPDRFVFDATLNALSNVDTISDFSAAQDEIALDADIFSAIGTMTADAFHVGGTAQDAEDRILYKKFTGALFYDPDGNGPEAAVKFAVLTGSPDITFADFIVV
jgi:Ca2+-binding RTX toxin-like protein